VSFPTKIQFWPKSYKKYEQKQSNQQKQTKENTKGNLAPNRKNKK